MDSFFDYIIIIFFIISLTSSLFKDKKKKKPPVETTSGGDYQYDFPDFEDDYDTDEYQEETYATELNTEVSQTPLSDKKEPEFIPTTMEDKYKEILERRKAEYDLIKESGSDEAAYESSEENIRVEEILEMIKEPQNFRNAFVVSELIGKPVGLRDLNE